MKIAIIQSGFWDDSTSLKTTLETRHPGVVMWFREPEKVKEAVAEIDSLLGVKKNTLEEIEAGPYTVRYWLIETMR